MRTVFVNPERCIGCRQCELACAVEHSLSGDPTLAFQEAPTPRSRVHVGAGEDQRSFPNLCRHCDPAPCLGVCPTGAIRRDEPTGLVLVDEGRCIGCAMCAIVCPFDVLTFHATRRGLDHVAVAVKCDGCLDRRRRGAEPACVETCKVDALVFGELNDLVAAGRLRETAAVLAATATQPAPPSGDDPLGPWRAWGANAVELARRAAHVNGRPGNGRSPWAGAKGGAT